jgi:hypothetical protein
MIFRTATVADVASLASARWAFRTEDASEVPVESEQAFAQRYETFVRDAIASHRLTYWLALTGGGELIARMAVCVIHGIPRPSRLGDHRGT